MRFAKLIFIFSLPISCIFGHPVDERKVYIDADCVAVTPKQIYIQAEGISYPVKMLSTDEQGLYAIINGVNITICSICNEVVDTDNQSMKCPHPWWVRD